MLTDKRLQQIRDRYEAHQHGFNVTFYVGSREVGELIVEIDRLRPIAEAAREWRDAQLAESTGDLKQEIALLHRQESAELALFAVLGDG